MRREWTTKEEQVLRNLIAQGYGGFRLAYRLAKETGTAPRSSGAVGAHARILGLSVPKPPAWTDAELNDMGRGLSLGLRYDELPDYMATAGHPRRTRASYQVKASKVARAIGKGRMACAEEERVILRKRVTELELAVATLAATVATLQGGAA